MTRFLQALVVGLGNGSVYALIAIGFVVIYKSTQVINFAQPALMLAGGVIVSSLAVSYGLNFFLALALAAFITAAIGMVIERVALRPMVGKPVFAAAIITLGIDLVVRVITNKYIGINVRPVGDPWGFSTVQIGQGIYPTRYFWFMGITALLVAALFAFFKFSSVGLAMRATAFDQEVALAQGVSVGTVFALSWAIAAGLAAIAGAFVGAASPLEQTSWTVGLKALPAIILGGLDSVGGAVLGGLGVGLVEALVAVYQPDVAPWLGNNFAVVSPYLLMLLVLLVRPYGLFGTPEIERV